MVRILLGIYSNMKFFTTNLYTSPQLYSEGTINAAVHHLHSLPAKDDIDAATVLLAILYEALTTSVLVLVALHAAIDKGSKVKPAAPVVLGFSVTVGILAT